MNLSKWIRALIILTLCLGAFFRVFHVDHKVYWEDETLTLSRVSGYNQADRQELLGGSDQLLTIGELQSYQKLSPERDFSDTMIALYEHPEHSPLYFVATRLGMEWFDNSKSIARYLSVFFSCLTLPLAYWLGLELFRSHRIAGMFTALLSISPLHVLYAQEARTYSLWGLMVIVSGIALLRAIRLGTRWSWLTYAVTISIGLYSALLSGLVFISYGIFVLISHKFRLTRNIVNCAIASAIGGITFLPWLLIFTSRVSGPPEWSLVSLPLSSFVRQIINNLVYVFGDFWFFFSYYPQSPFNLGYGKIIIPLVIVLILWAYYQVLTLASVKERWFILALTGSTSIVFLLVDIKNGSYLSTMSRYLIPSYMGVQLAVAFALARLIEKNINSGLKRRFWKGVTVGVVTLGVVSCAVSSQSQTWWNKRTTSYDTLRIAQIIQESDNPLIFVQPRYFLLSLSHYLDSDLSVQLTQRELDLKNAREQFDTMLFIGQGDGPPKPKAGRKNFDVKQVYKGKKASLWKLD